MLALKAVKQRTVGYLLTLFNIAGVVLLAVADVFLAFFVLVLVILGFILLVILGWMMNEQTRGQYSAIILSMVAR